MPLTGDTTPVGDLSAWLPERLESWVRKNGDGLAAIYAEFHSTGSWPEPVDLERRLRSRGERVDLLAVLEAMPPEIGHRETWPPRAVLSLVGIGCVRAAQHLMSRYIELCQLALARFDQPETSIRLSRREAVEALGLSEVEADRLSRLVVRDCPFLAGGDASPEDWRLDIDERVVNFEGVDGADGFLRVIVEMRQLDRPPAMRGLSREAEALTGSPGLEHGTNRLRKVLGAMAFALGVTTGVLALAQAPPLFLTLGCLVVVGTGLAAYLA